MTGELEQLRALMQKAKKELDQAQLGVETAHFLYASAETRYLEASGNLSAALHEWTRRPA